MQVILFYRHILFYQPTLFIRQQRVQGTNHAKYLEITYDKNINFSCKACKKLLKLDECYTLFLIRKALLQHEPKCNFTVCMPDQG